MSALIDMLLVPFVDPLSRTWWGSLLVTMAVVAGFWWWFRPKWQWSSVRGFLRHPSVWLDVQLCVGRQALAVLWGSSLLALGWLGATHGVRWLDHTLGVPSLQWPQWLVTLLYSTTLFVVWDASRWITHWLMHRIPALWAFHQVHHSAEVLTPLTFHRLHPLESLVYQLRGALSTGVVAMVFYWLFRTETAGLTLLGVPLLGLGLNALFGNLRHSHVWLRFPPAVEHWLISPAQHQLHHSADAEHQNVNYGTWLAVWDRWAGTLLCATAQPPQRFGIEPSTRNHGDDLLSAWFGPLLALSRPLVRRLAPLLLLLGGLSAQAQQDDEEATTPETEDEYGTTMIVVGEDGTPRVAGSAHRVDEETLQQYAFINIEQVLNQSVPGVNTRNEDGFGLRPNIGIRGASSDRSAKITLMEDGVLLAPAPYAAPAAYYFPMSSRLAGLEVFKGPAATRYGPHTVGGAINVLTRPVPSASVAHLDVQGGMWRTGRVHGFVGTGQGGSGVLVEGVQMASAGFKTLDTGGPTGFQRGEVTVKGRLALSERHRLESKLGYAQERSNETYLGLSAQDVSDTPYRRYAASSEGLMQWNRTQAEVAWPVRVSDHVQLRTVAYHHWLGRAWTKLNGFADGTDIHDLLQLQDPAGQAAVYLDVLRGAEDSSSDGQNLLIGTNDRRFHSFGLQSQARWRWYGERVSSTLTGGVRLHGDVVHRLHTQAPYAMQQGALVSTEQALQTTLESTSTARALAVHVHEDLRWSGLHVLPGVRVEAIETQQDVMGETAGTPVVRTTVLPGLGLMGELGPWTSVFVGSHRGFSPVAPGQPAAVQPELSWNHELGARFNQGDRHGEVVGFVNDYINLTGQCTLSGGCDDAQLEQQYNGGAVWVYGVESVAGQTILLPGAFSLPIEMTYTWTDSRFRTGFSSEFPAFGVVEVGDSLPDVPQHQGSARFTLTHTRFRIGMSATARSGMLNEAGVWPVTETDVPGLLLLDAAADVDLTERLQAYVTGNNLTNASTVTSWRPLGARTTPPLQIMVGLRLSAARD